MNHQVSTGRVLIAVLASIVLPAQAQAQSRDTSRAGVLDPADLGTAKTPSSIPASLEPALPPPAAGEAAADEAQDSAGPLPHPRPAPKAEVVVPERRRKRINTGIRGSVRDAETGEPLIEAVVKVVRGGSEKALTDLDGRFQLELPPGRYRLRVYYPLYEGRRVKNLNIRKGRPVTLRIRLTPWDDAIEEIVVYAEPDMKTESGMLEVRKESTSVADALSSQEMSRTGDSKASDAVRRVVSVTITDGKYVLLRGLGGRYVTTLLNGVRLPSPEPDRQAVPLDLFPTSLLSNLMVSKSYDPRNPGTFGGGTLQIETNTYPSDFKSSFKASTSANTAATLQGMPVDTGGGFLDYFGFDDGSRALPSAVPRDGPARLSAEGMDPARLEAIGESFSNNWKQDENRLLPNLGLGATVGDTVELKGRDLGYLATLTFSHNVSGREQEVNKVRNVDGDLEYRERMESRRGQSAGTVGGLLSTGYSLDKHSELGAFVLLSHTGVNSAQQVEGISDTDGQGIDSTRSRFESRSLTFGQVQGKHALGAARNVELKWQGNLALTSRSEPDTRDLVYNVTDDGRLRFKNETGSGERFFSELSEVTLGTGFDLESPLWDGTKIRSGASVQHSSRDFSARRFRFAYSGMDPSVLFLPPEELFTDTSIGANGFRLEERTMPTDAYDASLSVLAGYGAVDAQPSDDLSLSAGVRYERTAQELVSGSPFSTARAMSSDMVHWVDGDFLPGTSATYGLSEDQNLRAAYSYTLARPHFRELAPFLFYDYTRGRNVSGNPELTQTRIHNADLRWEWFPGDADVVAASVFYKKFKDPIEQVIVSAANGDVSFANAAGATTSGIELEARMGLGHFNKHLDQFKAWANVALIRSEVTLRDEQIGSQTSASRSLQGQSPYVVNLGFGYSDEVLDLYGLYNVSGRRIAEVGFNSLPDVYEQPFHQVDVTGSRKLSATTRLKLTAKNLLNRSVNLEQGDLSIFNYKPGIGFSLSLEWTPK